MKGFRDFLMQGNLIELAVAVVVGVAFGTVVTSLVTDFITPLIAAVGGQPDFSELKFTVNESTFAYGHFINQLVSFLIISAVVYFLVVLPVGKMLAYAQRNKEASERPCPECLSEIPAAATRCSFCTAQVAPTVPAV